MKLALSTNWCNRRLASGEEIVDEALALGFDELELGFHTTYEQVAGFKRRLGEMPVGSVHAFCPVPLSAPQGYPELYQLASFDESMRKLALVMVRKNVQFAAEMGASALVLHAGRVSCRGIFGGSSPKRRESRGRKLLEVFRKTLDELAPDLERYRVTLALENLPYAEGFPNEGEMLALLTDGGVRPVKAWFDTGHDWVRKLSGWETEEQAAKAFPLPAEAYVGMHVNDSKGGDDHFAPGDGDIDFAVLKPLAEKVSHLVLEPSVAVPPQRLKASVAFLRQIWAGEGER